MLALVALGARFAVASLPLDETAASAIAPPPGLAPVAGPEALRARLDAAGPLVLAGERLNLARLRRLYRAHGYEALWDKRREAAASLRKAVLDAGEEGLEPAAFHGALLSRPPAALSGIERDLVLSDAFLLYADALAEGGVPVENRPADEALAPPTVDVVAVLERALSSRDPAAVVGELAPASRQYRALRRAYARYRDIARGGGWPRVPAGARLAPGAADPRVPLLQKRLAAEGYLPQGYASEGRYDGATEKAVSRFQQTHGLGVDGVLGPETLAELDLDAGARARQIAINMERLRWLPRAMPADRIEVGTASARLRLFKDDNLAFETRVVVGAVDRKTPEFQSSITNVLFNPPWYVPYSIAQKEILPRLADDPDYLSEHHMRFWKASAIEQLPGPDAALGQLKFVMEDRFDVYLHDTPEKSLFHRANRRVSHGCVRVENPRALAALLLGEDLAAVNREVAPGNTHARSLPQPLPVFVLYRTAVADPDGGIEFRRDWYRRDDQIWRQLHRSSAAGVAVDAATPPGKG
ncbi:MAG TPA: L,D-transpeptidase family protein [Stellaceae bacterium]|nr:L,D-transpeptidase family protein [Stellaceae bacterium]